MIFILILLLVQSSTTTNPNLSNVSPIRCEKGERGEKGEPGICPADCGKFCLASKSNNQRLIDALRHLITESKKIFHRNLQDSSCSCPSSPKGDLGSGKTDCVSNQGNYRIFNNLEQAMQASLTYPDHTYVHIVDEFGRLKEIFVRVQSHLFPIRLENSGAKMIEMKTPRTIVGADTKPKCSYTLPCSRLHLFGVGPHVKKMCHQKRATLCSRSTDYDELCNRIAEQNRLIGFYRAFLGTKNLDLSKLFHDVCSSASIVNMKDETIFDEFQSIFQEKPSKAAILDVHGQPVQFQYWWHGSMKNGTTSKDNCEDWTRHESRLLAISSRVSTGSNGFFHPQNLWPCSIGDSNMGIFCIETHCDKRNAYKH